MTANKNITQIDLTKKDGTFKKWLVCPIDGLRYYRY